jgi:hypothetical protein
MSFRREWPPFYLVTFLNYRQKNKRRKSGLLRTLQLGFAPMELLADLGARRELVRPACQLRVSGSPDHLKPQQQARVTRGGRRYTLHMRSSGSAVARTKRDTKEYRYTVVYQRMPEGGYNVNA